MENDTELKALLEQFSSNFDKLSKKVDRMLTLNTKIAKSLHLIPVTEKEERELQLLQRANLQLAAKVNDDLNAMSPKKDSLHQLSIGAIQISDVFSDALADDYLPKR